MKETERDKEIEREVEREIERGREVEIHLHTTVIIIVNQITLVYTLASAKGSSYTYSDLYQKHRYTGRITIDIKGWLLIQNTPDTLPLGETPPPSTIKKWVGLIKIILSVYELHINEYCNATLNSRIMDSKIK